MSVFLSFSFVYALTTSLNFTYSAKEVLILVFLTTAVFSVAFVNKLSLKISAVLAGLVIAAGVFCFVKKPILFKLVYNKLSEAFLWLTGYINGELPLSTQYQKYTALALSIAISLALYVFTVKRFNFYVLLAGGISLFAVQWILEYFVSFIPFYVFLFIILLCYIKHIYMRSSMTTQNRSFSPAVFLLAALPFCGLVSLLAYYLPSSDKPIEWEWMDSKIRNIQSFINSISSLESEYFSINYTGFGEDGTRLGGNANLDDILVMKVDSPRGNVYLKGAVRELYTGFSWKSVDSGFVSLGEKLELSGFDSDLLELAESSRLIYGRRNIINEFLRKDTLKVTYNNLRTKTLFLPAKTESIRFSSAPLNVLFDSYGILSSENYLGKQFEYTIEFYSLEKDNDNLANLLRNSRKGLYSNYMNAVSQRNGLSSRRIMYSIRSINKLVAASRDTYNKYLQLPQELPERVKKLAFEITSEADNDFDRVKSIESYLSKNYTYTLQPGTVPKNQDFVDYFLFDSKKGYCTYYATAMTVLVRSLGIPARYVEGYVVPSQPVSGTTYEITNKQAHAWVEVYFEGFGWLTFEPTSPFSQNLYGNLEQNSISESNEPPKADNGPEENNVKESSEQRDLPASEEDLGVGVKDVRQFLLTFLKLFVPALPVFILLWGTVVCTIRRKLRVKRLLKLTPQQTIIQMYKYFIKSLSALGYTVNPGETPLQYAERIDSYLEFYPIDFKKVTDIFIKARYSNMTIKEKDRQLMIDFYRIFHVEFRKNMSIIKCFLYNCLFLL